VRLFIFAEKYYKKSRLGYNPTNPLGLASKFRVSLEGQTLKAMLDPQDSSKYPNYII